MEDEAAVVNKALDLSPGMKEKCIAPYHDRIQKLNKSMNHNTTATMQVYEGEMSTTEDNQLIGKLTLTEITRLLLEFLILKPVSS